MAEGTLFYLMGVSGSGKDSLLDAALVHMSSAQELENCRPRRVIRYITRDAAAGGESHHTISEAAFEQRQAAADFCMWWQAHGYHYGIHREIIDWLADGENVIVNGSRAYLDTAREVVPALVPILVDVSAKTQQDRLRKRARESGDALQARLERTISPSADESAIIKINNEGSLSAAVKRLCDVIVSCSNQ